MQVQDFPIHTFKKISDFEEWLDENHKNSSGIWIRFFKKKSNIQGITYDEALDVALCYGWIDSLVRKYDDVSYIQKFSQRKPKSVWSKVNTKHIERLISEGKMKSAGLEHVENAKKNGQWDAAYDSPADAKIPEDFLKELDKNEKAKTFFKTLNKANVYAISWRLQTAKKQETRKKRMHAIITMLSQREKFH